MRMLAFTIILLSGFFTAFLISSQASFASPVGLWKFDEGSGSIAYDSAGDNDGTLVNGPVWTTGKINGALSFDGDNDYVDCGNDASLNMGTSQWTATAWFKISDSTEYKGILGKWNSIGNNELYRIVVSESSSSGGVQNKVSFVIYDGGTHYFATSTTTVTDDKWHCVTGVKDSNRMRIYVDGVHENNIAMPSSADISNSAKLVIGRANEVGGWGFNGLIDDVRIYNRALSAGEIAELYREWSDGKAFVPYPINGATGVNPDIVLNWFPGKEAASHDVYFGTNYSDVNDANTSSPEYRGNFDFNNFDPCVLDFMTTYYWRIDEVNEPNIWKGNVWSFRTRYEPNFMSWWKFDEGNGTIAYDSAGSNNGTLVNGPVWTSGQLNWALDFDGTDDYVSAPDSNSLDFSTEDLSISLWIKPVDLGDGGIVGKYDKWGEYNYAIWYEGGILYFEVGYSGQSYNDLAQFEAEVSSTTVNIANQWYHITGTYDHNQVRLYINGQEADSKSENRNLGEGTGPFCIGTVRYNGTSSSSSNETNDYFNGVIDDVRIYHRSLSAVEVYQLYQQSFGFKALNPSPTDGATCVNQDVVLSWVPGKGAFSHDVYFGTNYNDVNNADTISPEYKGNFDVNSFDPCGLELITTYYWRIDEVNEPNLWKGDVWSFETGGPVIELSATQFEFHTIEGGENPADQILGISNSGGAGTLNWQINESCGWLSAEPNIGSSTGEVDNVNLSVDISGLAAGTYTCDMEVSDPNASNSPQTVSITLHVGRALYVPSGHSTIQAAINAALDYDVVIVAPGTYTGAGNRDVDFKGKAITVKSENGPESCIIDCDGTYEENHRGFYFNSGEGRDSVLEGFTIAYGLIVRTCGSGGGIYIDGGASPTISKCIVTHNHVEESGLCYCQGGGIYAGYESNPLITDCVVSRNSVGDWGWGGGIYCSQITIHNSIISNNTALGYEGEGGGINGGCTVVNCTIVNNSTTGVDGGICGPAVVKNSIIWANVGTKQISNLADVNYSDVQGGYEGTGNINADPCFVTGPEGDYYLSQIAAGQAVDSPCVDAGSDTAANLGMKYKTTRTDEVSDGGIVDMGYHYYIPTPSDIDGDGDFDFADFAILAWQWLDAPGEPSADIAPLPNGDNIIDGLDLGLLSDFWLTGK